MGKQYPINTTTRIVNPNYESHRTDPWLAIIYLTFELMTGADWAGVCTGAAISKRYSRLHTTYTRSGFSTNDIYGYIYFLLSEVF